MEDRKKGGGIRTKLELQKRRKNEFGIEPKAAAGRERPLPLPRGNARERRNLGLKAGCRAQAHELQR